jgi:hypothetical protein
MGFQNCSAVIDAEIVVADVNMGMWKSNLPSPTERMQLASSPEGFQAGPLQVPILICGRWQKSQPEARSPQRTLHIKIARERVLGP